MDWWVVPDHAEGSANPTTHHSTRSLRLILPVLMLLACTFDFLSFHRQHQPWISDRHLNYRVTSITVNLPHLLLRTSSSVWLSKTRELDSVDWDVVSFTSVKHTFTVSSAIVCASNLSVNILLYHFNIYEYYLISTLFLLCHNPNLSYSLSRSL